MFVGREKELCQLKKEFSSSRKSIVLVYGKRRVGKTTLVVKASEDFDGVVISFEALRTKLSQNLQRFSDCIASAFKESPFPFSSFKQAFEYINSKPGKKLILFDEYPDLKFGENGQYIDSMFREIVDSFPDTVKLVITGSHIKMMRNLLEEDNPLFARFTLTLKLEEFDYFESSLICRSLLPAKDRIALYAVFGGLPYLNTIVDASFSLRENIENLLVLPNGQARLYIENVLMQELSSISAGQTVLSILGNTKMKYSEIESRLGGNTNGGLARQLDMMLDMELIRKVAPINKLNDKKKTYYEISNNLVRFYYTYLASYQGRNFLLSPSAYFDEFISKNINTFISYRFEDIARQYFRRRSVAGKLQGIRNIGTYWYDDRQTKTNGEFDCVLEKENSYSVFEVKYYDKPLSHEICRSEADKILKIKEFPVSEVGFVSAAGFDFSDNAFTLISGDMLYEKF